MENDWKNRKMDGKTGKGLSAQWVIEVKWSPLFLREALSGEHQVKVDPTPRASGRKKEVSKPWSSSVKGPKHEPASGLHKLLFLGMVSLPGFFTELINRALIIVRQS